MFYAEPLDVAPALLQSVLDIVNDAASFHPMKPGFMKLCGGFHADFAVECSVDRMVLLCFGCGEAKLVTSEADDYVDLAPGAEEHLWRLLGGVRQFRPPQQFDDPIHLDPASLVQEAPDRPLANRSSWKTLPPPRARAPLAFSDAYSHAEYERLQQGLVPADEDDRWFVFFEEPWLYFHRSWTGACTFAVRLVPVPDGARAAEAWVARERYKGTDAGYDAELLRALIDALLLGRNASFPVPTSDAPAQSRFRRWVERLRSRMSGASDG